MEEVHKPPLNWQLVAIFVSLVVSGAVVFVRFGEIQFQVVEDSKRIDTIVRDNLALSNITTVMRLELADATAKSQLKLADTMVDQRERIAKLEQQLTFLTTKMSCNVGEK